MQTTNLPLVVMPSAFNACGPVSDCWRVRLGNFTSGGPLQGQWWSHIGQSRETVKLYSGCCFVRLCLADLLENCSLFSTWCGRSFILFCLSDIGPSLFAASPLTISQIPLRNWRYCFATTCPPQDDRSRTIESPVPRILRISFTEVCRRAYLVLSLSHLMYRKS